MAVPENVASFCTSDGYTFYTHRYDGELQLRGRIIWLHGIRSHSGWYQRSARRLASAGYELHAIDRRGSGWNTSHRGDTPGYRRLISDVSEFVYSLRSQSAYLPVILAGVSWGGKLALGVAASSPRLIDGVALLCPGLFPLRNPPFATRLRIALACILNPTRRFPIPLNEPELFTADPYWRAFIANHPHDLHEATARFMFESARFDRFLRRAIHSIRQPILLALAGQDRVINNMQTRRLLPAFTHSQSISILEYPDAEHTLEFESDKCGWCRDLLTWCERVTGSATD